MAYNSPSFEGSAPVLPMTDLSSVSMTAMTRPGVTIPDAYGDDYENPNPRSPIGHTIAEQYVVAAGPHGRGGEEMSDRAAAGGW